MTEEIINADGSRNWEANILLDNIKRLEQENKDFEMLAKSLYKRIEELEKENEALAFRERLYKADYEASEQENKELRKANEISIEKVTVTAEAKRLQELERENRELKETIKQYCEWLDDEQENNDKLQKVYQNDHCDLLKYRSALEEINITVKQLLKGVTSNYINNTPYLVALSLIENKINEVLE